VQFGAKSALDASGNRMGGPKEEHDVPLCSSMIGVPDVDQSLPA
jgi:hypothetical protein